MVAAEPGVVVDFVHPSEVGVPVNDGNVADDHPAATAWQARVAEAHCHIWVSPEYHSGMTGAMKNLFDFLGKEPMSRRHHRARRAGGRGHGRAEHA